MSQSAEKARAINLIKKLSRQTMEQGRTEHEASKAMEKVAELLEVFDLEMTDIDLGEENMVTLCHDTGKGKKDHFSYISWAVGKMTGCLSYVDSSYGGTRKHYYFGYPQDAEMAVYLMDMLKSAYEAELKDFKKSDTWLNFKGHRSKLRTGFANGFRDRTIETLKRLREEREKNIFENSITGKDLIPQKEARLHDEFYKTKGWRHGPAKSYSARGAWEGRSSGAAAAERVNFNRPVGGGSSQKLLK